MYYVLIRITENLSVEEQNNSYRGGIWLHTGVKATTRTEAMEKAKAERKAGTIYRKGKLKVVSEEQLCRCR